MHMDSKHVYTHTSPMYKRRKEIRGQTIQWEVPIHSKVFCFFFDLLFLETCPLTLSRNISIRLPPSTRKKKKPRALAPQQKSWKTKEHKGFYTYADRGYTFIYLYRLRLYFYFTSLVDFLHGIPIGFTPFFVIWNSLLYREIYGAAAAVSAHRQKDDQKPLSSLLTRATSGASAAGGTSSTLNYIAAARPDCKDIVFQPVCFLLSIAPIR